MVDPLVGFHFADELVVYVGINPKEIDFLFGVLVIVNIPSLLHTLQPSSACAMFLIKGYSVLDTSIFRRCYFLFVLIRFCRRSRLCYSCGY